MRQCGADSSLGDIGVHSHRSVMCADCGQTKARIPKSSSTQGLWETSLQLILQNELVLSGRTAVLVRADGFLVLWVTNFSRHADDINVTSLKENADK
jgi:hypothetical protein